MAGAVPSESDILCETCGYTLNGLPDSSNCPECGAAISQSTTQSGRGLTGFEERSGLSSFITTTLAVLLRPTLFYRALATRTDHPAAAWFAQRHRFIASLLFCSAAIGYGLWLESISRRPRDLEASDFLALLLLYFICSIGLFFFMGVLTRFAGWLSSLESAYWGMRLPIPVVRRCLHYHTASYLPIGIVANIVVWSYRWMIEVGIISRGTGVTFAYTLSGVVIASAAYLFLMYLTAMRQTRYANV
ncbi:MAG TPA: hypothetical protein PLD59_16680 [Tepidisphaeraceae bacterium]|nr:hypothetical protein [Tepidisphaeraceae bacterium]